MIETKVPQAKALDELFSRGGTEVNWMGLDVDDAPDKESEDEELLNYEQGPLEVKSNPICEQMKWLSMLHLQHG